MVGLNIGLWKSSVLRVNVFRVTQVNIVQCVLLAKSTLREALPFEVESPVESTPELNRCQGSGIKKLSFQIYIKLKNIIYQP